MCVCMNTKRRRDRKKTLHRQKIDYTQIKNIEIKMRKDKPYEQMMFDV